MKLVSVYDEPLAHLFLYRLMAERPPESWISHQALPTREEHAAFIAEKPFRFWYLVDVGGIFVGALECTDLNEVGVAIFHQYQHKGYGAEAINLFFKTHQPLPEIKARRNGHWLANISVHNQHSKRFFMALGFVPIQETLQWHK